MPYASYKYVPNMNGVMFWDSIKMKWSRTARKQYLAAGLTFPWILFKKVFLIVSHLFGIFEVQFVTKLSSNHL